MIARRGIVPVEAIDVRIEPYGWDFAREESSRIDAHWADRVAAVPALFDGRVLLAHRLEVEGDSLRGACFETGYRSFLAWRDFGFPSTVFNCFAMPALQAADGAFMLGEMSEGTANAGRLYFPAGTPEPLDLDAVGRIDFEANILRELEEETGLWPADVTLGEGWTIVFAGPLVACMKIARSRFDERTLQERFARFNAGTRDPELTRLVPVRGRADYDRARMPDFMLDYFDSLFGPA